MALLHTYLGSTGLWLQLGYTGMDPPQQVNDIHIMRAAIQLNQLKPHKLKRVNYWQLFLGVTTVSDITLADGVTLDPHIRLGNISLLSSSAKQLPAK
eukprot:12034589-Ditylum_brightwellii.AAC.1